METRKVILCCAASAAVSALIAVTATAAAIREEVQPPQLPEQSQSPAVPPESQDHEYILGEWEGRLAVYRTGESEPDSVLDVYLGLLPPADAQALREGIPVEDQTELDRRLEDFRS